MSVGRLGIPVRIPEDYQDKAAECLRLAEMVRESENRATLIEIANLWMKLADRLRAKAEQEKG